MSCSADNLGPGLSTARSIRFPMYLNGENVTTKVTLFYALTVQLEDGRQPALRLALVSFFFFFFFFFFYQLYLENFIIMQYCFSMSDSNIN